MIILNQFISILKDAILKKKVIIKIPIKIFILNILWVFYKNGYISGYKIIDRKIQIHLKYIGEKNVIHVINQISLISKRIYLANSDLKKKTSFDTTVLITNSSGVSLYNKTTLNKKNLSGEILVQFK
jgi:ribosomal protein S8